MSVLDRCFTQATQYDPQIIFRRESVFASMFGRRILRNNREYTFRVMTTLEFMASNFSS